MGRTGFFNSKNIVKSKVNPRSPQSCASCGLYQNCRSPRMKPFGRFGKKIMVVLPFPTRLDDLKGKPLLGKKGDGLKKLFKEVGILLNRDCLVTFACRCFSEEDDYPSPNHIYCCRRSVISTIKKHKPKVIILMDNQAIQSVIGYSWKDGIGSILKWRGYGIPDRTLNAFLFPVFSYNFVLSKEEKRGKNLAKVLLKKDLKEAVKALDKPFPKKDPMEDKHLYIRKPRELELLLKDITKAPLSSFDYEGNTLKPQKDTSKLASASICYGSWKGFKSVAFPLLDKRFINLFAKFLISKTRKTAHNLPFEDQWSYFKIKEVQNWFWDSAVAAHILDNRSGVVGLKFQSYVNLGIEDYDALIAPYLKSDKRTNGAYSINRIFEFIEEYGMEEVLKYNTYDSIYGFILTLIQLEKIYGKAKATRILPG